MTRHSIATPTGRMCSVYVGRTRIRSILSPGRRPARRLIGRALSCPVCGARVRGDDALGVVEGRAAHAECALVLWLGRSGCERLLHRAGGVVR